MSSNHGQRMETHSGDKPSAGLGYLRVKNLSKAFGNVQVLQNVSFEAREGDLTVFLGESGCGKSTLLRCIAGLEPHQAGQVIIGGKDVTALSPKERDIAFVFQSYALYPHMSVFDNMAFSLKLSRVPKSRIHAQVQEAAELLHLQDLLKRYPRELSGGQRQRVAIGRAIVRKPKLFLFDEPLSNLDAKLRHELRFEMKKLQRRLNITIIYVTHDQVEAMTLGNQVVLLSDGIIQQMGPPMELYRQPKNYFVGQFLGNPPMNFLKGDFLKENFLGGKQSKVSFSVNGTRLPCDVNTQGQTQGFLGIRPEDIVWSSASNSGIPFEVEFIEELGGSEVCHGQCLGYKMIVLNHSKERLNIGDTLHLTFPIEKCTYFESGSDNSPTTCHRLH